MRVENFINILKTEFYAGVPDSQLKPLCDYLINRYGASGVHHVTAANEGNAAALAAGYHLATGKVPAVYMQNSGQGNIINPLASLMNENVYGIPCIFIIGWRGEPGVADEPQHIWQGKVTCRLLEDMGVPYFIIGKETADDEVKNAMCGFQKMLSEGKDVAFIIRKGALSYDGTAVYTNGYSMKREDIIRQIISASGNDPVVCTTGKASRELFEIREQNGQGHERDFLTVGSMGHASSIALGVALHKPEKRVWCIDGDGAVLMHMGAMAVTGSLKPDNLIHIVINNGAHETVGGMPAASGKTDLCAAAAAYGYQTVLSASAENELSDALKQIVSCRQLSFLEVKAAIGARKNLGRPSVTPAENKTAFTRMLNRNDEEDLKGEGSDG